MNFEDRHRLISHAIKTTAAMDMIGYGLWLRADESPWWPQSKKYCERTGLDFSLTAAHDDYPAKVRHGTFTVEFMLMLLESFGKWRPRFQVHVPAFAVKISRRVKKLTEREPKPGDKLHALGAADCGLAIPVGLACGFYCAYCKLPLDVLRTLTSGVSGACKINSTQSKAALLIAFLIWSLTETGYFNVEDITLLLDLQLCSEDLQVFLLEYEDRALDLTWFDHFQQSVPADLLGFLAHTERVCAEVLWYLLRISTQAKYGVSFTTVAKENLNELFASPLVQQGFGQDLGAVFGALCILSEQDGENGCYKLVVPNALVTHSPYAARIDAALELLKD